MPSALYNNCDYPGRVEHEQIRIARLETESENISALTTTPVSTTVRKPFFPQHRFQHVRRQALGLGVFTNVVHDLLQ